MAVTKEECNKALETAKAVDREFYHVYTMEDLYKNKGHKNVIECFEQLINEHFELLQKMKQLEELVEKYDDKIGNYFDETYNEDLYNFCSDIEEIILEFEKNRFYKFEVKE